MTARPPTTSNSESYQPCIATLASSDYSDSTSGLDLTPSETPPYPHDQPSSASSTLRSTGMADNNTGNSSLREDVQPTKSESPAVQTEGKAQDAPDAKAKKVACKKHGKVAKKSKKKSKAKEDSSSSSSSDSSSSVSSTSEEEDSTDSESSPEEEEDSEEERKQRRRQKAKKARKLREKKKTKSRKRKESTDEESDSESEDDSSSDEDEKRRKSKSKKKRRSKKLAEDDKDDEVDLDDITGRAQAQLKALGIRNNRGSRRQNRERDAALLKKQLKLSSKGSKSKKKKQKRFVLQPPSLGGLD